MAEDSRFWNTDGTGDGDDAGITTAQMQEIFRGLFAGHTTNLGGVRPDYLNKLAVSGTSSPVAVASGMAVVYGVVYTNSASVNVTIPTPSVNPRIDRIVLRADWTAQTVRITRIAGSEAPVPAAPAMTQSAGTTWDIPLARVQITTGGVITVTDDREWLTVAGDGGITEAKMASGLLSPSVMYIPFLIAHASPGSPGGAVSFPSSSYTQMYAELEITKEHIPSYATVKLLAMGVGGTSATKAVELYNVTDSASVTGSEVTSTSSAALVQLKSSDFRGNLASGAKRYAVRGKISSGTWSVYALYLLVEW